jgi:hypothetical protein
MKQILVYLLLLISGCYGVYGFLLNGLDNPLVWALEGYQAPFLWFSLIGVFLWELLRFISIKSNRIEVMNPKLSFKVLEADAQKINAMAEKSRVTVNMLSNYKSPKSE